MRSKLPIIQIIILTIALGAAGFLYFITERAMGEVINLQREVTQQESNVNKLTDLSNNLPGLSSEIAVYLRSLPANEADVAAFAGTLETIAKDAGMTITFNFDDFPKPVDVSGQNISGLGSELVLEGSFQGLTTFLSRLTSLQYFFKIDKMTIVKQEQKAGIKASITGSLMMNLERRP